MTRIPRLLTVGLAALLLLAAPASAYNVKLKDGSLIFARSKYSVKGKKAIITLQNGTVTQIDLDAIDIAGTDKYNRENPGNVVALDVPEGEPIIKGPTPVPTTSLQQMIQSKRPRLELPPSNPAAGGSPNTSSPGQSWAALDPVLEGAFTKVFDGAGVSQYRLQNFRGTIKVMITANTEQAVFNALSASARALADYGNKGKEATIEISITTSSGEDGGTFQMTTDQARLLVNGNLTAPDYFVQNVVL